ncbi:MAG TPA: Mfa1 family fimbria major subunit, partial [Prevotella sp.]
ICDQTNRAKLTVKRTVARVVVTTTADDFKVTGDDPLTPTVEDVELGKVINIKYVVGQGEKTLYFMQRKGNDANLTYTTPNSAFKPTKDQYKWDEVSKQYDYSGLWKDDNNGAIKGIKVPTNELYNTLANTALTNITTELKRQLSGEFILPNTHKWGDTQDASDYRKNNTAYVLVRAQFRPKRVVKNDGINIYEDYSFPENQDFYMGANGVFYESAAAARDASAGKRGVANQTAAKYEKGKTLYYAWINPDHAQPGDPKLGQWINSPVNRNNIYHIQISGFKRIGANWNPLVPPVDPNDPNGPNPNNPDPRPNTPEEPNTPPVDPVDPLTPKETWMSVETNILPWNVHSYSVVLGI